MKSAARDLTRHALRNGYTVSVYDGEEWQIESSTSLPEIMSATQSVEVSTLRFDKPGELRESALIVYGNAPDEEVANFTCDGMIDEWFDGFFA